MVEKLQARLVAAEEAMREGEEREQELEHRLAQHEGNSVMKEADALEGEMAGAFASLRSGFGSFLGGKGGGDDAAKPGTSGGGGGVGGRGRETSGTDSSDNEVWGDARWNSV